MRHNEKIVHRSTILSPADRVGEGRVGEETKEKRGEYGWERSTFDRTLVKSIGIHVSPTTRV